MLRDAVPQPGHRAALGPVDLELEQLTAVHPHAPRGVELGDDAAGQLEDRVRGVVRGGVVPLAALVPAIRDVRDRSRGDRLDRAEQPLKHVRPVREHVEHDAAAVFLAVVPARALRRPPVAFEHPVPELAADRQDPAEEAAVDQRPQRADPRQEQLVLHHPVLDAGPVGRVRQVGGLLAGGPRRLLDVHVRAGVERLHHGRVPLAGDLGVEVDPAAFLDAVQGLVQAGGPVFDAVPARDVAELGLAAADQDRLEPDPAAVTERHAVVGVDRQHRPDQMLVVTHAPGDAVHDDPDDLGWFAAHDQHTK